MLSIKKYMTDRCIYYLITFYIYNIVDDLWDVRYAEVYKPGPTRSFKGKCNIKNLIDTIVF